MNRFSLELSSCLTSSAILVVVLYVAARFGFWYGLGAFVLILVGYALIAEVGSRIVIRVERRKQKEIVNASKTGD